MATCPQEHWVVDSTIGYLVGSAEQSFIHLDSIGELGNGKFVACTPCFRNEDYIDELHQRSFMKVELYRNDTANPDDLAGFIDEVVCFYRTRLNRSNPEAFKKLVVRKFSDGTADLELGGIEIGSYGVRSYGDTHWMYGTAIAEPRFSTALAKL